MWGETKRIAGEKMDLHCRNVFPGKSIRCVADKETCLYDRL